MQNIKKITNDNSENLEVDLDFSDESSDAFSDVIITDIEDIFDKKTLPFDDITQDIETLDDNAPTLDFIDLETDLEILDSVVPPKKEIFNFKIEEPEVEDEIIELVNVVQHVDITTEDDDIIELVNVVQQDTIQDSKNETFVYDSAIVEIQDRAEISPTAIELLPDNEIKLPDNHFDPSEEQVFSMFEKFIERRYSGQLDAIVSQVMENILSRQMDDIKKKILTALQ